MQIVQRLDGRVGYLGDIKGKRGTDKEREEQKVKNGFDESKRIGDRNERNASL